MFEGLQVSENGVTRHYSIIFSNITRQISLKFPGNMSNWCTTRYSKFHFAGLALKSYWRKTQVGRFCPPPHTHGSGYSTALILMVRRPEPVWQRQLGQSKPMSWSCPRRPPEAPVGRPANPAWPHEAARCRGAPPAMAHLPLYQPNRQKRQNFLDETWSERYGDLSSLNTGFHWPRIISLHLCLILNSHLCFLWWIHNFVKNWSQVTFCELVSVPGNSENTQVY